MYFYSYFYGLLWTPPFIAEASPLVWINECPIPFVIRYPHFLRRKYSMDSDTYLPSRIIDLIKAKLNHERFGKLVAAHMSRLPCFRVALSVCMVCVHWCFRVRLIGHQAQLVRNSRCPVRSYVSECCICRCTEGDNEQTRLTFRFLIVKFAGIPLSNVPRNDVQEKEYYLQTSA